MIAALPVDGKGLHGASLGADGFTVFDAQDVVGLIQKPGMDPHLLKGRLPGGRERLAGIQLGPEQGRKFRTEKGLCGSFQEGGIFGFRTEAQIIAELSQNLYAACGKAFCGRQGHGDGKFQNQVSAGKNSGFCAAGFADDGRHATLDEVAAHGADNGGILPEKGTNPVNLLLMSQMQGIIFANNTNGHGESSLLFGKIL
jgi:hypothetical protein